MRKLPETWGKVVVFTGYSGFLHHLQLASHDLAAIWQKKWRKNEIPNSWDSGLGKSFLPCNPLSSTTFNWDRKKVMKTEIPNSFLLTGLTIKRFSVRDFLQDAIFLARTLLRHTAKAFHLRKSLKTGIWKKEMEKLDIMIFLFKSYYF